MNINPILDTANIDQHHEVLYAVPLLTRPQSSLLSQEAREIWGRVSSKQQRGRREDSRERGESRELFGK